MSLNIGSLYGTLALNTSGFNAALQAAQSSMNRFSTNANNAFGGITGMSSAAESAVTALSVAVGGLAAGFSYLTAELIKQNSTLEQTMISYKYLTGSMTTASQVVKELRDFAAYSPFQSTEVFAVGQQLINSGVEADKLLSVVTAIGDASSVTGEFMVENFKGAGLAIAQMYLKGKVSSEEMTKQLSNRQIPAWEAMSLATGKSTSELKNLASQGKLGSEYIDKLIQGLALMREGASEAQSFTFGGMIQTSADLLKQIGEKISESSFSLIKSVLKELVSYLKEFNKEGEKIRQIGRIMLEITTPFVVFFGILKDGITQISNSSIGNVVESFDNLTISLGNVASSNFGGEIFSSIANSLALLINFLVGFIDIFKEVGQAIIELLNILGGFQQIATIIGYIVAFNLILKLLTSTFILLGQKITSSLMFFGQFYASVHAGNGVMATFNTLQQQRIAQSGLFATIIGAETAALINNAAASKLEAAIAVASARTEASEKGKTFATLQALGYARLKETAATLANAEASYANAIAAGVEDSAETKSLATKIANARQEHKNALTALENALARQVSSGAISAETAELLKNTLAQNANNQAQIQNIGTARSFASHVTAIGSKLGIVTAIIAALVAAFSVFEFAIFGTTHRTKAILLGLLAVVKMVLMSIPMFIAMMIYKATYELQIFAGIFDAIFGTNIVENLKAFRKSLAENIGSMANSIASSYGDVADAWNNVREISEEELAADKEATEAILVAKNRIVREQHEEEIAELNKQAAEILKTQGEQSKAYKTIASKIKEARKKFLIDIGGTDIYKQLLDGAKAGKRAYIEEVAKINDAEVEGILKSLRINEKVLVDSIQRIQNIPIKQRTKQQAGWLASYVEMLKEVRANIEFTKTLLPKKEDEITPDDTVTSGGGKTQAEKDFDEFKEFIRHKRAMNEISLQQEIDAWSKQQKLYTKNTEDQEKIAREIKESLYQIRSDYLEDIDNQGREEISKQKELNSTIYKLETGKVINFQTAADREIYALQVHRNKLISERKKLIAAGKGVTVSMDAINAATEALTEARRNRISDLLSDEFEEIQDAIEKRNQAELDSIQNLYDKKIKIIEDAIQKEKELYDKKEDDDKERELRKELDFLKLSIDKEAVDRVKEINKELDKIAHDRKIKQMEDDAELQKKALEEQRDIALEAQEEINEKRLKQSEIDFEKTREKYLKLAEDTSESISSISKKIDAESNNVEKAGQNWVASLIKGIEAMKDPLSKVVNDLAYILDTKTMLGELKTVSETYSNLDVTKTASPLAYYDEGMGKSIAFNAPILSVGTMVMGDKLDAQTLGSELYNTMIAYSRTTGGTVLGRG